MAYFGGLRAVDLTERLDLKLEQIIRSEEGYTITHTQGLSRGPDKTSTKLLVPEAGGYTGSVPEKK
jgi:hypothetical protein